MSATEFIPLNWNPLYQNADKETKQIAYINPKLGDISSPIYSLLECNEMSATEFIPLNWNPLYQNADKETKQIAYINPKLGDISSPIYSLRFVNLFIFESRPR